MVTNSFEVEFEESTVTFPVEFAESININDNGTGDIPEETDSSEILLIDRTTGKQYVLYVEDGKLSMEEKIAEIVAAICGMTLCGQTVCGG